jgi:lysophospholipase L1-like esterase
MSLPWSRFVTVGDSLSEGVGDPMRGSLRGWADRLADALRVDVPDLAYWNLARRSLLTSEVRHAQLDRALELSPDLVSVVVGMNDLLSQNFSADGYRDDLASIVSPLAASGATVVMGTFPPDLPLLRLMPRRGATKYRSRLAAASDVVRALASEHDAVLADAPDGWRYTMSECSIDGCHPNARGHIHIAQLALEALCARSQVPAGRIEHDGYGWLTTSARHLRWLTSQGYLRSAPAMFARLRQSRTT